NEPGMQLLFHPVTCYRAAPRPKHMHLKRSQDAQNGHERPNQSNCLEPIDCKRDRPGQLLQRDVRDACPKPDIAAAVRNRATQEPTTSRSQREKGPPPECR